MGSGRMGKEMEKESGKMLKQILIKVPGLITELRDMEFIYGTMEIDMRENGHGH